MAQYAGFDFKKITPGIENYFIFVRDFRPWYLEAIRFSISTGYTQKQLHFHFDFCFQT